MATTPTASAACANPECTNVTMAAGSPTRGLRQGGAAVGIRAALASGVGTAVRGALVGGGGEADRDESASDAACGTDPSSGGDPSAAS